MEENVHLQLDKQLLLKQLNELVSYVYDPAVWDGASVEQPPDHYQPKQIHQGDGGGEGETRTGWRKTERQQSNLI